MPRYLTNYIVIRHLFSSSYNQMSSSVDCLGDKFRLFEFGVNPKKKQVHIVVKSVKKSLISIFLK